MLRSPPDPEDPALAIAPTATTMAFVASRDRTAATRFYAGVLGFALVHEDEFASVFDLAGVPLRISEVAGHVPASHTVLGWRVPDIEAAVRALAAAGVSFSFHDGLGQDGLGIWRPPGTDIRVAWFADPDGNVLSVTGP